MELSYTPEQVAFRKEVTAWVEKAMPPHLKHKAENGGNFEHCEIMEWHRILAEKGWAAPHWPKEHGGPGWDAAKRFLFSEATELAGAPLLSPFGLGMVGPLIIQFGNERQKQRFLPKILSGEEVWCQGYSEPNAGSDLASVTTRAENDGEGHYIVNGQKTWTTYAQYAHWIFLLVRTNPSVKKQSGISFLLADLRSPGITVKPFLTTGGTPAFCETWFENVRVPVDNLVGEENMGWTYAKALLGHERTLVAGVGPATRILAQIRRIAAETSSNGRPLAEDPAVRRRIAEVELRLEALRMANFRALASAQLGHAPGPESSILKIRGTEIQQEALDLAMELMGPNSLSWFTTPSVPEYQQWIPSNFNYIRAASIYAGSNEIQRNVIAKMILGLPS